MGAAIAKWIRLHLSYCRPGSNPKHTIYGLNHLKSNLCYTHFSMYYEKTKIKQKDAGVGPFVITKV